MHIFSIDIVLWSQIVNNVENFYSVYELRQEIRFFVEENRPGAEVFWYHILDTTHILDTNDKVSVLAKSIIIQREHKAQTWLGLQIWMNLLKPAEETVIKIVFVTIENADKGSCKVFYNWGPLVSNSKGN